MVAIGTLALGGMVGFIDGYGRHDQAAQGRREGAQAIVVLGAHVNQSGQPGNSLLARARHAVELYRRGIAPHIVCSGGIGDYPPSEAQAAASFIERQGVPRSAVFLEDKSTSTWENARFTARLCRSHGWKKVVVVSEPFHLFRAHRDFQGAGLISYMSPANESRLAQARLRSLLYSAREALLLLRDSLWRTS